VDGWEHGSCIIEGYSTIVHAFRTKPIQEVGMGQKGGEQRITPYGNIYKRKLRLERKKP
jgi:hypothetical protein